MVITYEKHQRDFDIQLTPRVFQTTTKVFLKPNITIKLTTQSTTLHVSHHVELIASLTV